MSSSNQQAPEKKTRGRQKMKMEKIENENNLRVTFSKRRVGIFKKASELCMLCAAEVLIIIYSPGRKAYSFGHPDVERVMNRFLNGDDPEPTPANTNIYQRVADAARNYGIRTKNLELTQMKSLLDVERKRGEELDAAIKAGQDKGWIPPPLEDFNVEQLKYFDNVVSNFQKHLHEEAAKFKSLNLNPPPTGFNETNELYATGDMNVTNNIGSSVFFPNNNATLPQGLNDITPGFNDTGLHTTGGISGTNDLDEFSFASEFSSWEADFSDTDVDSTGQTSAVNNTTAVPISDELSEWVASFCDTPVYTGDPSGVNLGAVPDENEFFSWSPGFGDTEAIVTGETSGANNNWAPGFGDSTRAFVGETSGTNNNWEQGFGDTGANNFSTQIPNHPFTAPYDPNVPGGETGAFTTGETGGANNAGAAQVPHEFNNRAPGFGDPGVNTISTQDPNDPFTAHYDPNVPGGDPDPFNLMTRDPTDPILFGGSHSSLFPGLGDGSRPSQF